MLNLIHRKQLGYSKNSLLKMFQFPAKTHGCLRLDHPEAEPRIEGRVQAINEGCVLGRNL